MYITGDKNDFEQRLHQLPINSGDLQSFVNEHNNYTGDASSHTLNKWEREISKKELILQLPPLSPE